MGVERRRRRADMGGSRLRTKGENERDTLRNELDQTIRRLCMTIKVRNEEVEMSERQTLQFGRCPGVANRRWAITYFRKMKQQLTNVARYHRIVEIMQTLREQMRAAEDMSDAYADFAKYSEGFKTVLHELESYNIAELLEETQDALVAMREMDNTVQDASTPEVTLSPEELEEYNQELQVLEEKHSKKSLDSYLYTNMEAGSATTTTTTVDTKDTEAGIMDSVRRLITS